MSLLSVDDFESVRNNSHDADMSIFILRLNMEWVYSKQNVIAIVDRMLNYFCFLYKI